jgi:GlpG protein
MQRPADASTAIAPASEAIASTSARPWATWTAAVITLVIFLGVGLRSEPPGWRTLAAWGAPSAGAIWNGAYWGLVTTVFVHVAVWHLAFNLYWLLILGRVLEGAIGPARWVLFFLGAAIVSTGAELAVAGTSGIGLSGVVYAIFGFLWIGRRSFPTFARVLPNQTVLLFLIWLAGCMLATRLGIANVGNAAHAGGLAFGVAAGFASTRAPSPIAARVALAALLVGSLVPLFWCPWSFEWCAEKAYRAHVRKDYRSAVAWYRKSQSFHRQPEWVLRNLALAYRQLGDTAAAAATAEELRRLDPKAVVDDGDDRENP